MEAYCIKSRLNVKTIVPRLDLPDLIHDIILSRLIIDTIIGIISSCRILPYLILQQLKMTRTRPPNLKLLFLSGKIAWRIRFRNLSIHKCK